MPGKKWNRFKKAAGKRRARVYEALRKGGMSKTRAAKIAMAGKTKAGRSRMAKRAARTRAKRK